MYPTTAETVRQCSNYNLFDIVTPIRVDQLRLLLDASGYDSAEAEFLLSGFTQGFKVGYEGLRDVKVESKNLKFRVGNKFDLWDKIMTEVEANRYAGPYDSPEIIFPQGYYVNACGLVPKGETKTRLIHHYSCPKGASVNDFIPDSYAKVVYQDFQDAVRISLELLKSQRGQSLEGLYYSRTDAKNTFRVIPIFPGDRMLQVLKAENPKLNKFQYFVDLCCGFGSRSSCFLYRKISSCLRHLYRWKSGIDGVVYLDDGLQIGLGQLNCNNNLQIYLDICRQINLPTSKEKTEQATQVIKFLGLLLNAIRQTIGIPIEKVHKALNLIEFALQAKKVTVLDMQRITGLLNFFTKAIVPGRAFTRRMYASYSGNNMMQHHHLRLTKEVKLDLGMWKSFLRQSDEIMRPFVDFTDD